MWTACLFCLMAATPVSEVLGVTHVAGAYDPDGTPGNYLKQGADEVLRLGSRTIKLWLANPQTSYGHGTQWPDHFDSLVDMAKHRNYAEVFQMPFKHFILETYLPNHPEHYWVHGVTEEELAVEREAFRALTAYLLVAYRGTGKTFVLQHWEGDWAARGHYDAQKDPAPEALQGMARWLNARQEGVDAARALLGEDGVQVYHAAEVNLVRSSMLEGRPNVVNQVLPKTHLDLVSYSSYDTLQNADEFKRALDFIAENMPDSAAFGAKNVYIGEYGWPETDSSPEKVMQAVHNVVDTALAWGCPYAVYWELYCNEPKNKPVRVNSDARGFWLIRPDGTKSPVWDFLQSRMQSGK